MSTYFVFRAGLSKLRVRVQAFLAQISDIYQVAGIKVIHILDDLSKSPVEWKLNDGDCKSNNKYPV